MKFLVLFLSIYLPTVSFAAGLTCVLEETLKGEITSQSILIPASDDPHGSIVEYNLSKYLDYQGIVALSAGFTVISLVNSKTGVNISTQSKSAADSFARLQVILGTNDGSMDSIVVQCGEPK